MQKKVALTGGIASGKSAVADLLAARGAVIVDSDVLAREVVAPGTPGLAAVVERFGAGVLHEDGSLNRPALGAIVFADDDARADLNAITHPRIRARADELRAAAPAGAVVVDVIPLLVEANLVGRFDEVIVVDVPEEVQVERLRRRDGFTRDEAMARLAAQASREDRRAIATHVVDNTGSRVELEASVDRLWRRLTAS